MAWQQLLNTRDRLSFTGDLRQWYQALWQSLESHDSFTLALLGGAKANTPGLAFLAGYQAALRALLPDAPAGLGSLCVTEQKSLRPADCNTHYANGLVSGAKDFVLGAEQAQWLLVTTRENLDTPKITLVRVDAQCAQYEPLPALKLMPDVQHAKVRFESAPAQPLPGDGWDDYAKPFRTLEDIYVLTALLAWHLSLLRDINASQDLYLKVLNLLGALANLAKLCPKQAVTHLLLAGAQAQYQALAPMLTQALAGSRYEADWLRDQSILTLAAGARQARLNKALVALKLNPSLSSQA